VNGSASEGPVTAFVVLKGGLTLPVEALRLALALEDRGATFAVDGDDLVVDGPPGFLTDGPPGFLTEDDRIAIRRWRVHLKAITTYQAPEVE
jgi:hypothetical protein